MSEMVIMAYPQDAAKIVLLDDPKQPSLEEVPEGEAVPTRSWLIWATELKDWVASIANDEKNEVEQITFVGPKDYIQPFVEDAEKRTGKPVKIF